MSRIFCFQYIAIYSCMLRYYHQMDKFHNLLRLLSNEVVHRAIAMVGEDILREPLEVCKGDSNRIHDMCLINFKNTGEPLKIAD